MEQEQKREVKAITTQNFTNIIQKDLLGESPGCTPTQRYADVIPSAHAAPSSSAKPPQRAHRADSQSGSTSQKTTSTAPLYNPHHLSAPQSSPLWRRHGAQARLQALHATGCQNSLVLA
ncbi:hypothetical protein INR49_011795 [Caranx melampygus]|nr:hypothetical protein INR49_011795 [Caranx melampygus]